MANQFLIKNTMLDMRNLSASEVASLQGGSPTYAGVELLGYYSKGDTPVSIIYFLSNTLTEDNGGSVIQVSNIKLEHIFSGSIDVKYFGCKCDGINNDSAYIQNAINYVSPFNWHDSIEATKNANHEIKGYLTGSGKIRVTKTIFINPYLTIQGYIKGSWFGAEGGLEFIGDFDGKEMFVFDTAPYNTAGIRIVNHIGTALDYDGNLFTPVVGWTLSGINITVAKNRNIKGGVNRAMATNSEIKNCRIRGANIGIQSSACWGGTINRNLILSRAIGLSNRSWVNDDQQWGNYITIVGSKPNLIEFEYPNYDGNINEGSTCCVYSWGSLASHYNNIWESGEIGFMVMGQSSHRLINNYSEAIGRYVYCSQSADLDIILGRTVHCNEAGLIYCTSNNVKVDFGNISTFNIKSLGYRYSSKLTIVGSYKMFAKIPYSVDFKSDVYLHDLNSSGSVNIYVDPLGNDDNWGYTLDKPVRTLQEAIDRCLPGCKNIINKSGLGEVGDTKFNYRDGYNTIDKEVDLESVLLIGGGFKIGKVADLAVHNLPRGIKNLQITNVLFTMDNVSQIESSFLISIRGVQHVDLQQVRVKGGVLFGAKSNDIGFANLVMESCTLENVKLQQQGLNGRLKWIETSRNTTNIGGVIGSTVSSKISSDLYN